MLSDVFSLNIPPLWAVANSSAPGGRKFEFLHLQPREDGGRRGFAGGWAAAAGRRRRVEPERRSSPNARDRFFSSVALRAGGLFVTTGTPEGFGTPVDFCAGECAGAAFVAGAFPGDADDGPLTGAAAGGIAFVAGTCGLTADAGGLEADGATAGAFWAEGAAGSGGGALSLPAGTATTFEQAGHRIFFPATESGTFRLLVQ